MVQMNHQHLHQVHIHTRVGYLTHQQPYISRGRYDHALSLLVIYYNIIVSGTWRSQIVDVRAFAAYKCALFYQHAPNDSFHLNITHSHIPTPGIDHSADNHDKDEESNNNSDENDDGRNKKQELKMATKDLPKQVDDNKYNNEGDGRHVTLKGANDLMTLKWLRGIALLEWIMDFIPDNTDSM
jgi:hypothetical protein